MSAGMRSGVNWIRENSSPKARARVRTRRVFPSPGTPFQKDMALAEEADEDLLDHLAVAHDHFPELPPQGLELLLGLLQGLFCDHLPSVVMMRKYRWTTPWGLGRDRPLFEDGLDPLEV
jgi:hypothetical protein